VACYSFYGDGVSESWQEHSLGVLNVVEECFMDNAAVLATRLGVDRGLASILIKLASAFHDVGKILNMYQLQVGKRKKVSYFGHEVLGAYIVDRCLLGNLNASTQGRLRTIAVAAVMMHHQAMRSLVDWWVTLKNMLRLYEEASRWKRTLGLGEVAPHNDCIDSVEKVLRRVLSNDEVINEGINCIRQLRWENPQHLVRDLDHWYASFSREAHDKVPKEYLIIVGPLVISDNVAAHIFRSRNCNSLMVKELEIMCPKFKCKSLPSTLNPNHSLA